MKGLLNWFVLAAAVVLVVTLRRGHRRARDLRDHVQQAIRQGLDAANRGELVEQDDVEERMTKWLGE